MEITYSELSGRLVGSEIREILIYTRMPGIISFAGGLPDPGLFPLEDIARITKNVLDERGYVALQYGPTPGEPAMIEALVEHMSNFNETAACNQICVTSSSQQGLDLISLTMVDKDSEIIMELPSYLGAIQAFGRSGANMTGIRLLNDGMDLDQLEEVLKTKAQQNRKVRFIYTIPDFQNPAGILMSLEKRKRLIELSGYHGIPIVEDSPYREISFNQTVLPSLWTLSKGEGVIQLKTFSKMLFPGMRLGWMTAQKEIIEKFALAKQSVDLCTPSFNQLIIAQFIREGKMKATIQKAVDLYRDKNACMLNALSQYMPNYVQWSKPTGGMFLWAQLPELANTKEMVKKAAEKGVVYVTGRPFHCDGSGENTMRLNYSFPSTEQIKTGINLLADTIITYCHELPL